MHLSRVLPWVTLGLAVTACPSSSAGHTPRERATAPSTPSRVTTSPAAASAPVTLTDEQRANALSLELLKRIKNDDVAVSGTSIRQALVPLYAGARGTTAREMSKALSLDPDPATAMRFATSERALWDEVRGNAELTLANRLWIDKSFTLRGPPNAETVPFDKPEEARKTINAWVAEKTKEKIPEVLPPGSVSPQTRLVVTNAVAFKARWEVPFPVDATKNEPFTTGRTRIDVPSMHTTDAFRFTARDGVKVLELRYADSQLAMLVVLPDDPSKLAAIESSLSPQTVERWTQSLATARVAVTLPRFGFRFGGPMRGQLAQLGMQRAFTESADFSGLATGDKSLYIDQVVHQTWVAVDEHGTEAAAATAGATRTMSMITGPVVDFRADHPFLFFLRETKHGRILFAGRLLTPKVL